MKKLCLGTLLRILCDAKLPTTKQYLFLSDLLSTVKSDDRYDDSKFQSALLSGKNNLVDYEDILIFDKKTLVNIFESKIKPNFDENGQRLVIICVRDVLKEDTTINDSVTIGFEKEGYTKQDLLNKQIFPFSAFLDRNILYFEGFASAAQESNYYIKGKITDDQITDRIESADASKFVTPTFMLVDFTEGNNGVTSVFFGVEGDTAAKKAAYLLSAWNYTGDFAPKN